MKSDAIVHRATLCANCATPVAGHFCTMCGQETTLHVPSAREFMHEFVGHYVALEGKLWMTLRRLLFKPGRLTRDYIEGRRARYVQPLRLYLTLSIIFFALFRLGGHQAIQFGAADDGKPRAAAVAPGARAPAPEPAANAPVGMPGGQRIRNWLARADPKLGQKADKFLALSGKEQQHQMTAAFYSYAPYAMFCLMPLFAFYLKLLYLGSGRRYGEHLLFALHSNAFAFLMLILLLVVPPLPFLQPALAVWLVAYLPVAMWRVYGGSRLGTGARWLVLALLHVLSVFAAILGAMGLALVA